MGSEATEADVLSPSPTTREAPQRIPSGSLSFREHLPQMAELHRHGRIAVAAQETAYVVRIADWSGSS